MSPHQIWAIRYLAKHFHIRGEGYNPMTNDEQADDLLRRLRLTVESVPFKNPKKLRGQHKDWVVKRGEHEFARFGGLATRNEAIVEGACRAIDEWWDVGFDCWKEGLDPVNVRHIVDARS